MADSALDVLETRGMIQQISQPERLRALLANAGIGIYVGFDPTARSLHVGHLLPIMALAQLQRHGHRPIVLVGGATGMIGDPSGRSDERQLLTPEQAVENAKGIRVQLESFVSFDGSNGALMVDNNDWIAPMSYISWLREVGKFFTVNYMLAKESVRRRLEDRDQGISYTEFSYMLLQAYDFLHLYRAHGCLVQAGGQDQWGNITAGIDLVRKVCAAEVFGMTFPLVTTAAGEKFGKSASNAVWLAPELTSPYEFYQYWMRTDDRDVDTYLKFFTFLPQSEIEGLCAAHRADPDAQEAQRVLAREVTTLVHGQGECQNARRASEALFAGKLCPMPDVELSRVFADVPSTELPRQDLTDGLRLVDLLSRVGACESRGEARRLIQGGGCYLNNLRITDVDASVTSASLVSESSLLLRTGKRSYLLVRFVG